MESLMRCPVCGQANRVPELDRGKTAVCGKCKTPLIAVGDGALWLPIFERNEVVKVGIPV